MLLKRNIRGKPLLQLKRVDTSLPILQIVKSPTYPLRREPLSPQTLQKESVLGHFI
jgi:hypothetical protein